VPKPTALVACSGHDATMFQQIPDSVYRENLIPVVSPTALVSVSGGQVSAEVVEKEVPRIMPVQSNWRWEAFPHGDHAFLARFPS
jgi:hypothetical protein